MTTTDPRPMPRYDYAPMPTAYDRGLPTPPEPRRRIGWQIAGVIFLAVALLQLTLLPEWVDYDQRGLVGHLTGVLVLVGVGVGLLFSGRGPRRA